MDITDITSLISSVGFPIVACIIMWKTMQETTAAHKAEVDGLRDALERNTTILTELKTMLQMIVKTGGGAGYGSIYSEDDSTDD